MQRVAHELSQSCHFGGARRGHVVMCWHKLVYRLVKRLQRLYASKAHVPRLRIMRSTFPAPCGKALISLSENHFVPTITTWHRLSHPSGTTG